VLELDYVRKDAEKRKKEIERESEREGGGGMRHTTLKTHLRKNGLALAPQPMP
jgi:hypothetical protein